MNLAEKIAAWAAREDSIRALVLIGSQVRAASDAVWRADAHSDWDFQIIAARPELFSDARWIENLGLDLRAYVVRRAAIGGVPKVAALFADTEADFVILPAKQLRLVRWLVRAGLHRRSARLRRAAQDLAVVVRPGWKFLKDADGWESFYRRVIAAVGDPRLDDDAVRNLADGFVCDVVWTLRKIGRGESLAAQRTLHRSLVETNFRLLHELKLRRGERTFPEARRAERILRADEVAALTVNAAPDAVGLRAAVERCSATCREFVRALVGESWQWPKL